MNAFRFLHSSDLHLGRAFGGYPEGIRHRLREARHGAIARLAQAARAGGAGVVLLAGDTFDAETPAPETLRQALRAMGEEGDLTWVLLPGNHDSLVPSLMENLAPLPSCGAKRQSPDGASRAVSEVAQSVRNAD